MAFGNLDTSSPQEVSNFKVPTKEEIQNFFNAELGLVYHAYAEDGNLYIWCDSPLHDGKIRTQTIGKIKERFTITDNINIVLCYANGESAAEGNAQTVSYW